MSTDPTRAALVDPANAAVRAALARGVAQTATPWSRWRIGVPRVRWPVLTFQWALFFSMFGLSSGGSYGGEGSSLRQVSWVALLVGACLGVVASPQHFRRITSVVVQWRWQIGVLVLFWLFATLSIGWAEYPGVTAKRTVLLALVIVLCVLAAASATVLEVSLVAMIVPPLLALLGISILFTAAFPGAAFSPIGWQGMTGHKNIAGQLCAFLVLSVIILHTSGWLGRTWIRWCIGLVALGGLAMSRSATSLVCLLAALGVLALVAMPDFLRRRRSWVVPAAVVLMALLVGAWLLFLLDALPSAATLSKWGLSSLGKSDTLTGRTKLWDLVMAQDRYRSRWLGLGYGGFWDSSYGQIVYVIQRLGFRPIQAHNGYLDLYNEVGLIGLGLALCVVLVAVVGVVRALLRPQPHRNTLAAAALLTFILVSNFAESSLMRTTNLLNLLFIVAMLVGTVRTVASRVPVGRGRAG